MSALSAWLELPYTNLDNKQLETMLTQGVSGSFLFVVQVASQLVIWLNNSAL